ncbi:MAG TPA: FRG domain-containing protein [Candidatus Cloacimonadota bacterium]|nr:FRG domain-containing protein [Candidatus Cloacimonadota bacterium]
MYKNKDRTSYFLNKFDSKFCYKVVDDGVNVLHVQNPHVLSQLIGYAKYIANREKKSVLIRGQDSLYGGRLMPSLYRGIKDKQISSRNNIINSYCSEVYNVMIKHFPKDFSENGIETIEPILQHYGIRTRWIDLVDNIWIALWFATHTPHDADRLSKISYRYSKWKAIDDDNSLNPLYLPYYESKNPYMYKNRGAITYSLLHSCLEKLTREVKTSQRRYAYILLLEVNLSNMNEYGVYRDEHTRVVDLRYVCPSVFLRPHNQHGLLMRRESSNPDSISNHDFFDHHVSVAIRIDIKDALSWLGTGFLLTPEFLFPSPFSDFMYRHLIELCPPTSSLLGQIIRYWQ